MSARRPGELALVLHTHMPYVEGFGTWPFGEEWLWEAMVGCYLPLADLLRRRAPALTLSLTPVLCDQLEAPGTGERFERFVREVRGESHGRDVEGCRAGGEEGLARELERAWTDYERAAAAYRALGGDLLGALAPYASWTSAATHAVLPLLATGAGIRLQVQTGVASHRRRFGDFRGGFWLPECAHAPWLDPLLREAGVRAACVDLTDVYGAGAPEHLRPLASAAGLLLAPIDRETIERVWSPRGYPAAGAYRDYHHHTTHHHCVWGNDGRPYDHAAALALARAHAAEFVARVRERVAGGGLCVCALDTELLGHWWYEGIAWLEAVLDEADRQGLRLTALDDALGRHEPADAPELPVTSWGTPRDLSTWEGPPVAELAWRARAAELRLLAGARTPGERELRELLALQSSDWAFMVTRATAGPYAHQRADAHAQALADGARNGAGALRNLAPDLDPSLAVAV